jgi:hypothetical protein
MNTKAWLLAGAIAAAMFYGWQEHMQNLAVREALAAAHAAQVEGDSARGQVITLEKRIVKLEDALAKQGLPAPPGDLAEGAPRVRD